LQKESDDEANLRGICGRRGVVDAYAKSGMEWHLKLGVCAAPDGTESMKRVRLSKLNCDISISDIDCPAIMNSTMLRARKNYKLQERARAKPRGEHPLIMRNHPARKYSTIAK